MAKEKISIGLDIGTYAIKVCKLGLGRDTAKLASFAVEAVLPAGAGPQDALKRLAQAHGIKAANVSLSGSSTVTRYVAFPKMNPDELRHALKFEAQKHIPFAIEEVNIDAQIVKDDLPDGKVLVLIAAAKKDAVGNLLKTMGAASIKASLVDVDSVAISNAFSFNYAADETMRKLKVIALLNVGFQTTNLVIAEGGIPRFSRDIHIAGRNFTQKIADLAGKDFQAAEKSKLSFPGEGADNIKAAADAVFTNLAGEIRSSFDYYESQNASAVEKIFLSGGGSALSGFKDMVAGALGIEAQSWNPLNKIIIPDDMKQRKLEEFSACSAVAVGLALRQQP